MGYAGSERTTRRAVAEAKATYRAGHRRRFRPWLPEPGLWFQWDYADGPLVDGRKTWLWCAWLAWSRFRVVLPIRDKTLPTVIACIDATLRRFGGVPTYGLSDNEKTLTLDHIARIAVRHPTMVEVGRSLWSDVGQLCAGGSPIEGWVARQPCASPPPTWCRPTPTCCPSYSSFAEYRRGLRRTSVSGSMRARTAPRAARRSNGWRKNASGSTRCQPSRTRRPSASTREVGENVPVIQFDGGEYSVPDDYVGQERLGAPAGRRDRHRPRRSRRRARDRTLGTDRAWATAPRSSALRTTTGGSAAPHADSARTPDEAAFLAIGPGAQQWLITAAAVGTARIRTKMIAAVALAKIYGSGPVDRALATAAELGRFADEDLAQLLRHQATARPRRALPCWTSARSLQTGTSAWAGFGS